MTLVLGVYPLYRSDPVWEALLQIAGCDPGLEYQAQSYYSGIGLLVTYKQKRSTPAANRLKELVDYPRVAVLYGVGSTGVNPTDGKPLIASGGGSLTYHGDGSASVYVDVDDAFGRHYLAPGHGGTVWDSLPTIVYHELAHAYHFFKGDNPANYGAKEVLARTDENVFRAQYGLPLLNVHDDSDPGFGKPTLGTLKYPSCTATTTGFSLCTCNIATAALGSPVAREIVAFRRAKREFERLTLGSVPVLEPMLDSYQLFSPLVAGDMQSDPGLREAMLHYGVRPAVYLLQLVRSHMAAGANGMIQLADVDRAINQYLSELPDGACAQVISAAEAAQYANDMLTAGGRSDSPGDRQLPGEIFLAVASAVQTTGANTAGPAWVLAGLAIFLRAAAAGLGHVTPGLGGGLASDLGDWLTSVPLPDRAVLTDSPELDGELTVLRETLFKHESNREMFANRIRERWPNVSLSLDALHVDKG